MPGGAPNVGSLRASLSRTPQLVRTLAADLSEQEAHWSPAPAHWSIVEIINHMADEDADDFVPRLESTLRDPSAAWRPIDPESVAKDRGYAQRGLAESIDRFQAIRTSSLNWLDSVGRVDWSATHEHPKRSISAGDLLVSWAAHDLLHQKQITKRLYQLIRHESPGFDSGYAGDWSA